jgi:class 3 adenylate cyclase
MVASIGRPVAVGEQDGILAPMELGRIRYAQCEGLQIAYQVVGSGPVDLVQVPGLANHIEAMWDIPKITRFTERLASFSRLILLDKRGTALSERLPEERMATVEDRVHDVTAVLDAVGSSSAFLLATADGTPIAMTAAASYPERFQGLVLYGASARLLRDQDYPIGYGEEPVEFVLQACASCWGNEEDPGLWLLAPSVAGDPRWRASLARIERRAATPAEATRYWSLNLQIDVRSILSAITVPTLVLHTTGEQLYPVTHGRYVAEHIAGADFVEVPGTDHFCYAENGDRFAAEIEEFVTGRRSGPTTDRRLATVLITDVVGSTERSVEIGDWRWRALLDAHDRLLEVHLERHRGRLVKTMGDGCLAVFDGPRQALLAAESIRDAGAAIGLEIRSGVHTGEVELRGDDVAGIAVHIAARVSALADGGEILATRTVRDLVVGSTLSFEEHGEHELKGVGERWLLYRLASG